MSSLPGFSSEDTAPLPSKREMRATERGYRALEEYYKPGGNLSAVRKALKLSSNAQAQVLINRALRDWRERKDDRVLAIQYAHETTLEEAHRRLAKRALGDAADGSEMDLAATDRLLKVEERQAKLVGSDAEKDAGDAGVVINVLATPPWERGETIEGEAVEPPGLPSGN